MKNMKNRNINIFDVHVTTYPAPITLNYNYIFGIFCILIVIFIFCNIIENNFTFAAILPFVTLQKIKLSKKSLFIVMFILLFFTTLIFQNPFIILIIMVFLSIAPSLQFLLLINFKIINEKLKIILYHFLKILYLIGLLDISYRYYLFLNNKLSLSAYKVYIIFISFWFFSYILAARYLFFLKLNNEYISWSFIIIYFIMSLGIIIRGFTSFSWFIIPLIFTNYKDISIFLIPVEELPPSSNSTIESPSTHSHSTTFRYGGFFSRHYHNNNNYYPPHIPRGNFYRNTGLTLGLFGACCSAFACYTYYKSAEATIKSADAAALSAGAISKETYYKRHPEDRP